MAARIGRDSMAGAGKSIIEAGTSNDRESAGRTTDLSSRGKRRFAGHSRRPSGAPTRPTLVSPLGLEPRTKRLKADKTAFRLTTPDYDGVR